MVALNVGASTMTLSPGSMSVLPIKSSACWLPVVTTSWSGARSVTLAQGFVAFGRAVLQRGGGRLCQGGLRGGEDACRIKQGAVGKATGKADDAGFPQQFEDFADGGGFDVVQASGKGQRSHGGSLMKGEVTVRGAPHLGTSGEKSHTRENLYRQPCSCCHNAATSLT